MATLGGVKYRNGGEPNVNIINDAVAMQPNTNDNNAPEGNDKEKEIRKSKGDKIKSVGKGCGKFIWDGEKKEFCGRGARRWLEITIYYIVFYACLSAFYAGMVSFYYAAMKAHKPFLTGTDSLLKNNPGLMFYPSKNLESSVVRASDNADALKHVKQSFDDVLRIYNRQGSNYYCTANELKKHGSLSRSPARQLCDVSPLPPDECKGPDYGSKSGSPCVLLKLNRIYDFRPDSIQSLADLDNIKSETKDNAEEDQKDHRNEFKNNIPPDFKPPKFNLKEGQVHVKCFAENKATADNMGDLDYYYYQGDSSKKKPVKARDNSGKEYPPNVAGGFPLGFYPYLNQKNYRSPLVWVRFKCPTKYVPLMISCKAFAHNIYIADDEYSGNPGKQSGMVHFQVLNEIATNKC